MDLFDAKLICKKCGLEMKPVVVNRKGLNLRAMECSGCKDKIVHPSDLHAFEHYNDLKGKIFNVKLRMVGNSHAISIPKEIVDFFNETSGEMNKHFDNMVRLCFEDFGRLSVRFGEEEI